MPWTTAQLRHWLLTFAFSPDGTAAVRSVCRRYGIAKGLEEDLRQEWSFSLERTMRRLERDLGAMPEIGDEEAARRYAWGALKNRALDLLRAPRYVSDAADLARDQDGEWTEREEPAAADVEVSFDRAASLDELRALITQRLRAGAIGCSGCRVAVVVQVALAVLDAYFDVSTPSPPTSSLAGGSTELDELIYDGLRAAVPDLAFDESGRAVDRTRQLKSRCGRCVTSLLADVIGESHTASPSPADPVREASEGKP